MLFGAATSGAGAAETLPMEMEMAITPRAAVQTFMAALVGAYQDLLGGCGKVLIPGSAFDGSCGNFSIKRALQLERCARKVDKNVRM